MAECLSGWRPRHVGLALCALGVAVAIPANLAKLGDGSGYMHKDADLTRGELAMFELAGDRGAPDYLTIVDPAALGVGASPYIDMTSAHYLDMRYTSGEASPRRSTRSAAQTSSSAPSSTGPRRRARHRHRPRAGPDGTGSTVRSRRNGGPGGRWSFQPAEHSCGCPARLPQPSGLSRFTLEHPVVDLGLLAPGEWRRLDLAGADAAPDPWRLFSDQPIEICPLG